jgi:translation elongation factor EF-Tu-like GTPase
MKLLIVITLTLTPGHADYVKNMVTGAAQMDCLFLVVKLLQMDQCHKQVSTSFRTRWYS